MVKNKGAIANELKPFEPTHPGEVLKDEIDCRGISQRQLAHEIGVSVVRSTRYRCGTPAKIASQI